jgi:DNA oxidative demethylase
VIIGTEDGATQFADGAWILRRFAADVVPRLVSAIDAVTSEAPFRHMQTPSGHTMSVAMTNCGPFGWITDHLGYRYTAVDPQTGRPWPAMPRLFEELAHTAAAAGGYAAFAPDACLINRYEPGARMSLHQDRDERDFEAPIVSVSLGLPATFLFGGAARNERARRMVVESGDVVVWGGPSRLSFHGVAPLRDGIHPLTGTVRYNLTLRKAGLSKP